MVRKCAEHCGIDVAKEVAETRHLYAVGSILAHGYQNATVWGSGLLNGNTKKTKLRLHMQKLDVRAVRGPLTRDILRLNGQKCPEVYGDPAILMPMFYSPIFKEKKYPVSVIIHHTHNLDKSQIPAYANVIDILTTDYCHFINEVCQSELVISSTLHGIILAEAYGVPAVFLAGDNFDLFKYRDYYLGTGRNNVACTTSVNEALRVMPMDLPQMDEMRNRLLDAFPKDLWD